MSWLQAAHDQQVGLGRDLVTYWTSSWISSSSPDGLGATGAPARHSPSRGSDAGCPVYSTIDADSRPYWPCDTPVWRRTVDAIGSVHWDRTTPCNADTPADSICAPAMMSGPILRKQTRCTTGIDARRKRAGNKRRRPFSESFRTRRTAKKTGEKYAVRFGPKVQRDFQPHPAWLNI
jgi:hypothetical protein